MFDSLAEARIREWLARPASERAASVPPLEPGLPLELQLWHAVQQLDRLASETSDEQQAAAMRAEASDLMLRLLVLLESQGRPLAARHFAALRAGTADPD